mgnify:CR=1 FL=1
MNRLSQIFPLLLLAVLATLTFWLDQAVQQGSQPAENERADPDFIVDSVVARRLDANGNVKHTLYASKMSHYPRDDSTRLVSPRFVSTASVNAPVSITSRTARVSSGGENVYFEDDVRVVRAAYENRSEMTLETIAQRVFANRERYRAKFEKKKAAQDKYYSEQKQYVAEV